MWITGQDVPELFLPDTGHSMVTGRCQNLPDTRLPNRSVSEIIPGTDRNISGHSSQGTGSKDKSRKSIAHGTGQPDITGHNHSADSGRFHRTGHPVRTGQPDNSGHQQNKSGHNRGLTDNLSPTLHNISNKSILIYEPENHSNHDRSLINNSRQRATTSRDTQRGGKHTPSLVRSLFYSHSRSRSRSHSNSVKNTNTDLIRGRYILLPLIYLHHHRRLLTTIIGGNVDTDHDHLSRTKDLIKDTDLLLLPLVPSELINRELIP